MLLTLNALLSNYIEFNLERLISVDERVTQFDDLSDIEYLSTKRHLFTDTVESSRLYKIEDFVMFRANNSDNSAMLEIASNTGYYSDISDR